MQCIVGSCFLIPSASLLLLMAENIYIDGYTRWMLLFSYCWFPFFPCFNDCLTYWSYSVGLQGVVSLITF